MPQQHINVLPQPTMRLMTLRRRSPSCIKPTLHSRNDIQYVSMGVRLRLHPYRRYCTLLHLLAALLLWQRTGPAVLYLFWDSIYHWWRRIFQAIFIIILIFLNMVLSNGTPQMTSMSPTKTLGQYIYCLDQLISCTTCYRRSSIEVNGPLCRWNSPVEGHHVPPSFGMRGRVMLY